MSYESVMNADFDDMSAVQRQILEVSDADAQVLTFTIDGQRYCINIEPVSEVLWNEHDIATVPNLADNVLGVANLRGDSVAVVDPKESMVGSIDGEEENLILFESGDDGDRGVAWLVDSVEQVLSISHDEIEESTDAGIRGLIERDDELIMWVDADYFSELPR